MDKVCLYGVYEFVGFHLCKRLLEKGFCVEGIHFDTDRHLFLEEKRLEIGRNANFNEKAFSDDAEVIIISLYDWFMTENRTELGKLLLHLGQTIKERNAAHFVYLLPIQLLAEGKDLDGVKDVFEQIKQGDQCVQYFYLPTIFGPWQPPSFLFQKVMLDHDRADNGPFTLREWPLDAIYVEDILNPLIESMEARKTGSFLLESGIPKSWDLCAELLNADELTRSQFNHRKLHLNEGIEKLVLKVVTPYDEALMAQKKHLSYLLKDDLLE